ncbi:hypothetical protein BDW74DRAFT_183848 [Aspergillus multicolor]|uniref:uncharacterized protein n=1 Tax=Aspergillus multicolor TaxID=41759 RepID=UPI003CCE093C
MSPTTCTTSRPRDFTGYGDNPPKFTWPGGKKEPSASPLLGDSTRDSRTWLRSVLPEAERGLMQEAEDDYGRRVGIWRLLRIFREFDVPYSVFLSTDALTVNPALAERLRTENCDIVAHETRSISRVGLSEEEERADLRACMQQTFRLTGKRIRGAFPRPPITENTRRVMAEEGLLYDSATTNDDRPYFSGPGYTGSRDFFSYLKDAFDVLLRDAEMTGSATMMSIGLHARIMRPERVAAVVKFLEYVLGVEGAWVAKREDIARAFVDLFKGEWEGIWNVDVDESLRVQNIK